MIDGAQPRIRKDPMSALPDHDFPPPRSLVKNENVVTIAKREDNFIPDKPTDKERSANTRQFQANLSAAAARGESVYSVGFDREKQCGHCGCMESTFKAKMKHCKRCRRVSYCNKDCQVADWSDQKLIC